MRAPLLCPVLYFWLSQVRAQTTAQDFPQSVHISLPGYVSALAFSPEGDKLAFATPDGQNHGIVSLIPLSGRGASDWQTIDRSTTTVPTSDIGQMDFCAGGSYFATITGLTVYVFDGNTAELTNILKPYQGATTDLAFSPDGKWLAVSTQLPSITVWAVSSFPSMQSPPFRLQVTVPKFVTSLAYDPTGKYLATGMVDGSVTIYAVNAPSWSIYKSYYPPAGMPSTNNNAYQASVAYSPDGKMLAWALRSYGTRLVVFSPFSIVDFNDNEITPDFGGWWVSGLAFSPDGATIAVGTSNSTSMSSTTGLGKVSLYSLSGTLQQSQLVSSRVAAMAYHPLNVYLTMGSLNGGGVHTYSVGSILTTSTTSTTMTATTTTATSTPWSWGFLSTTASGNTLAGGAGANGQQGGGANGAGGSMSSTRPGGGGTSTTGETLASTLGLVNTTIRGTWFIHIGQAGRNAFGLAVPLVFLTGLF